MTRTTSSPAADGRYMDQAGKYHAFVVSQM